MMAMTTSSSIKVNARRSKLVKLLWIDIFITIHSARAS